jgi:hypothetical protein
VHYTRLTSAERNHHPFRWPVAFQKGEHVSFLGACDAGIRHFRWALVSGDVLGCCQSLNNPTPCRAVGNRVLELDALSSAWDDVIVSRVRLRSRARSRKRAPLSRSPAKVARRHS